MRKGGTGRGMWFVFGDVPASFLSLKQNKLTRRGLGEEGISFRLEFQVTVHHCEEVRAGSSAVAQHHIHRQEQRGRVLQLPCVFGSTSSLLHFRTPRHSGLGLPTSVSLNESP